MCAMPCVCVCLSLSVCVCVCGAGSALLVPPMIMINSFNEWHDGSEIEPSKEEGETLLNLIAQAHILKSISFAIFFPYHDFSPLLNLLGH
jgi:hypothetical protein